MKPIYPEEIGINILAPTVQVNRRNRFRLRQAIKFFACLEINNRI